MDTQNKTEVLTGTICAWIAAKGWGFVSRIVNEGTFREKVYKYWVHASSFTSPELPMVGMKVSFSVQIDHTGELVRGGKYPAIENVTIL